MKVSRSTMFLVKLALGILGYGLLAYAASRTLEFVQATMPSDKQWMGYLYLLATGIGALIWLHVYLNDAKGAKQRGLSMGIAIIDLLAEFALVYADTMREASKQGMLTMTSEDLEIFILASVLAVALNAFAWFFYTLCNPEKEQERKAADLADEIEDEAMKILSTPAARKKMIQDHAPTIETAIMARVTESIAMRFTGIPADPRMPIIPAQGYEQNIAMPTLDAIAAELPKYNHMRPPNGNRQHPDLLLNQLPLGVWQRILQEWEAHDDALRAGATQEAGETPSPFLKGQPE